MKNNNEIDFQALQELRQTLHKYPEVSRREFQTSAYMQDYLKQNVPPDRIVPLADAGFAVVYDGADAGPTVMVRAELDALSIHEVNTDINYRSVYDGVAHKCGHDGHMAMLAGLAQQYARQRPAKGRVVLLFQPDEEMGTGAKSCLAHPNFVEIEPDYVFALHNFPGYEKNEIIYSYNSLTSSVIFTALKLTGREAHSAMPETGVSPAEAIAEITKAVSEVQDMFDSPGRYALIVPIRFDMGVVSSGVAPGDGEAHYTLRAAENDKVEAMWENFWTRACEIAERHGLGITYEILEEFAATSNTDTCVNMIVDAADRNTLTCRPIEVPFRAGEDFGQLISRYKGAIFGLGAGIDMPQLHNPDYDFPDRIMPAGIAMFSDLVEMALEGYGDNTLTAQSG